MARQYRWAIPEIAHCKGVGMSILEIIGAFVLFFFIVAAILFSFGFLKVEAKFEKVEDE